MSGNAIVRRAAVLMFVCSCGWGMLPARRAMAIASDAAPNVAWIRQIGKEDRDDARGVAVDRMGNVFVIGTTESSLGRPLPHAANSDVFLAKYDTSGVLLGIRQSDGAYPQQDEGNDVALDGAGNSFIVGSTDGSLGGTYIGGYADGFLSKFDANGTPLWNQQIGSADYDVITEVAVDGTGNAYISGYTHGNLFGPHAGITTGFDAGYDTDGVFAKFDPSGTRLWSRQFGLTGYDYSQIAGIDEGGNLYIHGVTDIETSAPKGFLAKYDVTGSLVWSRATDAKQVVVDGTGSAFYAEYRKPAGSLGQGQPMLEKYDSSGALLWSHHVDTLGKLVVDSAGNVYMSWSEFYRAGSNDWAGLFDVYCMKYDANGMPLWITTISSNYDGDVADIAVDSVGNIYIVGYTYASLGGPNPGGPYGYPDGFVAKLSVPEPSMGLLGAWGLLVVLRLRHKRR